MIHRTHLVRLLLALPLIAVSAPAFTQHQPGDGAPLVPFPGFDLSGHGRFFYDAGDLTGMLEYVAGYDTDRAGVLYNGVTLGGYYRVHPNVKLGAFYRLQFGARHDEDWIKSGSEWIWRDTTARPEHVAVLDVTPRFLLDFLPGRDWVFAVKGRYEATMYGQDGAFVALQSLLIRPGLTYFFLKDREPLFNISLQYGSYWALDFGESPWYSHGPYLNFLYHLAPGLQLDASGGFQFVYWTESTAFDLEWPNNRYAVNVYMPFTVDVGIIYQLR